ncbi:MAG: PKD domain-containing protein, partial [Bacteroidota bacterium]
GGMNFGWPIFEGMDEDPTYSASNTPFSPEAAAPNGCVQMAYYKFVDLIIQDSGATQVPYWPDPCSAGNGLDENQHTLWVHSKPAFSWRHGTGAFASVDGVTYQVGNGPVSGGQWGGGASTAGVWYTGTDLPAEYQNTYFHADYSAGWIRQFTFDGNDQPLSEQPFDLGVATPVALASSPISGGLYYVSYGTDIRRFVYSPTGNQPPMAVIQIDTQYGPEPLTVQFTGDQSTDPENDSLSYLWDFGDGTTSTQPNPVHIFDSGTGLPVGFTVSLTVTDPELAANSADIIISVNNTPPRIDSSSIDEVDVYQMDAPAILPLYAHVSDDEHSGNELSYSWLTSLYHNDHNHPEPLDFDSATSTVITPVGCDGAIYWYRVTLTVTDAGGLQTSWFKDIFPNCGAPQAIVDEAIYTQGGSVQIPVLANDFGEPPVDSATVGVVLAPIHGTTSVDPLTGVITYTHDGSESFTDQFDYVVLNVNGDSSNIARVFLSRLGPPAAQIISPSNNQVITGAAINATVTVSGDTSQIHGLEVRLDGADWEGINGLSGAYLFNNVQPGLHLLQARVVDLSGNSLPNIEAIDSAWVTVIPVSDFVSQGSVVQNGAATCYALTQLQAYQNGAIWFESPVNLEQPFDFEFTINLGDRDASGADGITFLLHQEEEGTETLGTTGFNLGAGGIAPSFGVEFDTYFNGGILDIADDHLAFFANGDLSSPLASPVCIDPACLNIEDGLAHTLRLVWDPFLNSFAVYIDGNLRNTYAGDLVAEFFDVTPYVTMGVTGSTGGGFNIQEVCVVNLNRSFLLETDTAYFRPGASVDISVLTNDVVLPVPDLGGLIVHTPAVHGTVSTNGDGTFSYQHDLISAIVDSFYYQVVSSLGDTSYPAKVRLFLIPPPTLTIQTPAEDDTLNWSTADVNFSSLGDLDEAALVGITLDGGN